MFGLLVFSVIASQGFLEGFTLIEAISILGATFAGIGAAIKWTWDKINARIDKRTSEMEVWQAELNAREKAFEDKRDSEIAVLKAEVQRLSDGYKSLTNVVAKQRTAIHLLVAKILKDDPEALELKLVEAMLGSEFPISMANLAALDAETKQNIGGSNE